MSLDFADLVGLSVLHASREMQKERAQRKTELKNLYQESSQKIVEDSTNASNLALAVIRKASRCYIPNDVVKGCSYLPLYAFALVLEKQRVMLVKEQLNLVKLYFETYSTIFPFTQLDFLSAVKKGKEIGNFREIISISRCFFKIERIDIPESEEERQRLKKQNFKNAAEDAYTG